MPHFNYSEMITRFFNSFEVNNETGCWNWNKAFFPAGYGRFWIKHKGITAHRVSWTIIHGKIPEGMCVCHKCDNKKCVNPDHLFLGTVEDNIRDRCQKGHTASGDKHGWHLHPELVRRGEQSFVSKLTTEQVVWIRQTWERKEMSQREMARQLHMNYNSIWQIIHRKCWTHIEGGVE